jgi:micrococcal nuclease
VKLRKSLKALMNLVPIVIAGLGYLAWNNTQSGQTVPSEPYQIVRSVSDGDTIELESREKIRLCGIDAPEKAQPLGAESKANLQRLIDAAGGKVIVQRRDKDKYGRTVAELFTSIPGSQEEKYLNAEQILSGNAYLYKQFSGNCLNENVLETVEAKAKSANLGVWKANVQKPWEFRKAQRAK